MSLVERNTELTARERAIRRELHALSVELSALQAAPGDAQRTLSAQRNELVAEYRAVRYQRKRLNAELEQAEKQRIMHARARQQQRRAETVAAARQQMLQATIEFSLHRGRAVGLPYSDLSLSVDRLGSQRLQKPGC